MDASVQRLYGPRGGMAFTRQSGGTCVPSAYKHLFVMTDLYRPFLLPTFDSVENCFPYPYLGKTDIGSREEVMSAHYNSFLKVMTSIPERNFIYKRFDDRTGKYFLPGLNKTLAAMADVAKKAREFKKDGEKMEVPSNTGIAFMSSPEGRSHAMAVVNGRFIDSNFPDRSGQLSEFHKKKWKLQAVTVVGVYPHEKKDQVLRAAEQAKERIDRNVVIQEYPHFADYDTLPPEEREDFLHQTLVYMYDYLKDIYQHFPKEDRLKLVEKLAEDFSQLQEKVKQNQQDQFGEDFYNLARPFKIKPLQGELRRFVKKHPPKPPDFEYPTPAVSGEIPKPE